MDPAIIDQIHLNFNQKSLLGINAAIALMMLGVSLDLKLEDFKRILVSPKAPAIGLFAQFILLPAFTFGLTMILPKSMLIPSMAMGMILVASCPGGNLSNIITYLAKGNCAVSISMTAISSCAAIFMTPLNLSIWGSLNPHTAPILQEVHLSPSDVFVTIFVILGIPMAIGITLSKVFPNLANKVRKPFKIFSLCVFMLIVLGALLANWQNFINVVGLVALAVFIHNALALTLGYTSGHLAKLPVRDKRAVAIEVGIQNSALGLLLVFNFFGGLGGMAIVVAWWGIWHIIAGLVVSQFFARQKLPPGEEDADTCTV
ncbi:bile acid:Na+ symporter, BASS family [Desulfatibacillum alkenivorans DSM 16219]|jgi:BASS family bile acid:Na+ symporter|uniref:Bile acid:Na+ symporter, BASS family n=1 Tax=Desulfatibacillum alkenivorans DSM 16219 TaxID=1121393 RepID=A0A1M6LU80_9BACT|nr:bile acid:sodium symporter family protein [Desulfatibacillum alkenivorans]SHJ74817.1 bile acid:Na+ symporter, BASS family [Desulfatibacillum alkenivorans DSM 16219]